MATYAIGDLQGCYDEFRALLDRLKFEPTRDRLWLVGDLVNRGPGSLAALRYVRADGAPAAGDDNPNGSEGDIAGLCNPAGNVLGLMPHPEDHVSPLQHPTRAGSGLGLALFQAGVRYAAHM
ncbi:MAG TPA: phosphoribosylformylglycinamidine synthase subunit PurQ [Myxococcota bacterium]|nr:phosphoribosylformylglycinamidine synthase subunit PurQ [Myxococcota bacterium]